MPVTERTEQGITTVRMDHGPVNALDLELCEDLADTFARLGSDTTVRAIVLTGNARAFCAGVDLRRVLAEDTAYTARFLEALTRCFLAVHRVPVPTVAAVNGHAIAGGCVLACAADRRVLVDDDRAQMGLTELAVGVPFPTAAVEIVRSRTGPRFTEAVYHARNHPPSEALSIGFVDELVPAGELADRAAEIAADLATIPRDTYALTKRQIQGPADRAIDELRPRWDPEVLAGWTSSAARAAIERFLRDLQDRRDREERT